MTDTPEPLFVVCWETRTKPKMGGKGTPRPRDDAQAWAESGDKDFPLIRHWIEPYTEDKK